MATEEALLSVELGEVEGIGYSLARTSEPWTLDIDTIVVSVGSTLGSLGIALRDKFGGPVWRTIAFDDITPQRPTVIALPTVDRADVAVERAVLIDRAT